MTDMTSQRPMNDFYLYFIRLQLNQSVNFINCSCELGPTMTSYDFLEASELFREMFELNPTYTFFNFLVELGQIMTSYDFLEAIEIIVINV